MSKGDSMRNSFNENKNIIHSKGIIDENYILISADEEFYRFVGPNIRLITDVIHQVDMDDFLFVVERLNAFAPKSMVIRLRRFDNTFRWCLVTIERNKYNSVDKEYINIEISDIINLNNHYIALNKAFDMEKEKYRYNRLIDSEKLLSEIKSEIENNPDSQLHLAIFSIDNLSHLIKNQDIDLIENLLDEIATELAEIVGERGMIARYGENQFMIALRNVGNESNLRSFVESARTKIKWMYINREVALNIIFTVGISEYPRNGKDFETIQNKVFKAFDLAREKGGQCYVIYKEELHGEL